MGALKLDLAELHRFLGNNLAAVGQTSDAFERVSSALSVSRMFTDQERPDLDILV